MINIYKFHHCPSLLATPGFEPTTFRSQSGYANHTAIPPPPSSSYRANVELSFCQTFWSYWIDMPIWLIFPIYSLVLKRNTQPPCVHLYSKKPLTIITWIVELFIVICLMRPKHLTGYSTASYPSIALCILLETPHLSINFLKPIKNFF